MTRATVVITNHDYGRFVADAVGSVLGQDHRDVEVIVVDDGSTDDSLAVLERFDGRVQVIAQANLGQAAAMNAGYAASTGDVVLFLDADDELLAGTVSAVVAAFARDQSVARVQFPLCVIDEAGAMTGDMVPRRGLRLFEGDALPRLLSCPDDIVWQPTSGNAFSRWALDKVMPVPEATYRLCADYHLSTLVPLYGPVVALDEPGGCYRVHGANGHYAIGTLDRVRGDVARTIATREELDRRARSLGLATIAPPTELPSVSHTALRIVSLRLAPDRHPVPADSRRRLARMAVASARQRVDLPWWRRVVVGAWLLALTFVPRPLVPLLARPVVRLS